MTKLNKARIQRLDEITGEPIEDIDILTSADSVTLDNGETVEERLKSIKEIEISNIDDIIADAIDKRTKE